MAGQQPFDSAFIATRYSEYKQNYFKIGREEARQPISPVQWSQMTLDERAIAILCDLFTVYHECTAETALSSKLIKACVTSIGTEAVANDIHAMLPTFIEWFVELDGNNEAVSLEPLIKSFIYLPTRAVLLESILLYDELMFTVIVDTLLHIANNGSSQLLYHISENLYGLLQKHPKHALAVRFKLVQLQTLPDLALRLTITHIHDDVNFLNGEFNGLPTWILSQSTTIAPYISTMKNNLCELVTKEISTETPNQLQLAKLMRAIIGLLGFFGIKATEEQFQICLQMIRKAQTERTMELSVCFILICAEQVLRQPLREQNAILNHVLGSELTDMPALVAVAFDANQILQVETMVREKLKMAIMIPKLGLFEMQKLFKTLDTINYSKFRQSQGQQQQ